MGLAFSPLLLLTTFSVCWSKNRSSFCSCLVTERESDGQMTRLGNVPLKMDVCNHLFWQLSNTSDSQSLSCVDHTSSLLKSNCTVMPERAECYVTKRGVKKSLFNCVRMLLLYKLPRHELSVCACVRACWSSSPLLLLTLHNSIENDSLEVHYSCYWHMPYSLFINSTAS